MLGIRPPFAALTRGKVLATGFAVCLSSITRRNPSSINAVSERPSSAALRLALRIRSVGRRTVVRSTICHDISLAATYFPGRLSQRNIVVLFPGVLEFLVPQHGERSRKPPPRRVRQDHLVDVAPFGGDERRQEARL